MNNKTNLENYLAFQTEDGRVLIITDPDTIPSVNHWYNASLEPNEIYEEQDFIKQLSNQHGPLIPIRLIEEIDLVEVWEIAESPDDYICGDTIRNYHDVFSVICDLLEPYLPDAE